MKDGGEVTEKSITLISPRKRGAKIEKKAFKSKGFTLFTPCNSVVNVSLLEILSLLLVWIKTKAEKRF
jgi:hypothetical protein